MMISLIVLSALALVAIVASVVSVFRDGYRRVPTYGSEGVRNPRRPRTAQAAGSRRPAPSVSKKGSHFRHSAAR
jgi:hypothetical protein